MYLIKAAGQPKRRRSRAGVTVASPPPEPNNCLRRPDRTTLSVANCSGLFLLPSSYCKFLPAIFSGISGFLGCVFFYTYVCVFVSICGFGRSLGGSRFNVISYLNDMQFGGARNPQQPKWFHISLSWLYVVCLSKPIRSINCLDRLFASIYCPHKTLPEALPPSPTP